MKEIVRPQEGESFDIELEVDLLKANKKIADENMDLLKKNGIKSIDVMGSIGAGKTTLITQMVKELKKNFKIGVIEGDLTTTIDSDIIRKQNVEVIQINTGKECHLDANLVRKALKKLDLKNLNLIIIENVGNLICPAEFPLGSEKRIVVISVTEGPNMVLKHPYTFREADVVVINKIDLAKAMGINAKKLEKDVHLINPKAKAIMTNSRKGEGVSDVISNLNL